MSTTKLNAEAVRPRSTFYWREVLWKVISNDTHQRCMVLEEVENVGNRRLFNYAPGVPISCTSIPHLRIV